MGDGLAEVSGPVTRLLPPHQCLVSAFCCLGMLSYTIPHLEPGKSWVQTRELPVQVHGVSLVGGCCMCPLLGCFWLCDRVRLFPGAQAPSRAHAPSALPLSEEPTGSNSGFSLSATTIWNSKKKKTTKNPNWSSGSLVKWGGAAS